VLTLRLVPRRRVVARSALAATESTGVLVAGHTWAGGMLPSYAWIALMAGAAFLAGLPVLRGRLRLRYAIPGLVLAQLLMHSWLTVLAPMPAMSGTGEMTGHGATLGGLLAPHMLLVHVAGAVVTALLWELRAQTADVIVTWSRPGLPPVPAAPRLPARASVAPRPATPLIALVAPPRGPPAGAVCVPAFA